MGGGCTRSVLGNALGVHCEVRLRSVAGLGLWLWITGKERALDCIKLCSAMSQGNVSETCNAGPKLGLRLELRMDDGLKTNS